jgi:hypothetical protein
MAKGYKIRLPEGIEVGPLDPGMLRSWYEQGMIRKDSPVQATGSTKWVRLTDAVDISRWREPAEEPPAQRPGPAQWDEQRGQRWRTYLAAALFLAAAVGAGYFMLFPERWLPSLRRAPWRELALGLAALGLLLVRGWELARRVVRILVLVLTWGLFPLVGILWVEGVRGRGLLVLAAAWVAGSGFFALLSGSRLPGWQTALSVLAVLAGGAGVGYLGLVPEDTERQALQARAASERRFADPETGVGIALPSGWVLLQADEDASPPPGQRAAFAHPELHATAHLTIDPAGGGMTPDQVLDRALHSRPLLRASERSDVSVAGRAGRQAFGSRDGTPEAPRDAVAAWTEGWTAFSVEASFPAERQADGQEAFASLLGGITSSGAQAAKREQAVSAVVAESPHLNARTVDLLMAAGPLPPPTVFRRASELANRGARALDAAESREMGGLLSRTYASLRSPERAGLAAYFERVLGGQPTALSEDRAASELMRDAVLRLPAQERALLQALYEKAVAAGFAAGP